jgi:hypothetical protein
LGLNLWRDFIVRNARIKDRLLKTLLDLVHKERTGEVINRWDFLFFHDFIFVWPICGMFTASADQGGDQKMRHKLVHCCRKIVPVEE